MPRSTPPATYVTHVAHARSAPPEPGRLLTRPVGRVLEPKSIAIVGASADARAFGHFVLQNLERFSYSGEIYLVSRSSQTINGRACVNHIDALPEGIDLAVLCIPEASVLDAVRALGAKHTGAAVIFASGYAETGAAGRAKQQALIEAATAGGLALIGPNCMGLTNFAAGVPVTFEAIEPYPLPALPLARSSGSSALSDPSALSDSSALSGSSVLSDPSVLSGSSALPASSVLSDPSAVSASPALPASGALRAQAARTPVGPRAQTGRKGIGILAQSGAMAANLRDAFIGRGEPITAVVSTGNEAMLGIEDYLAWFIADAQTGAIAVYAEQIRRPPTFLHLARQARAAGKPIVLLMPGKSARAKEAAQSHTGALAGDHATASVLLAREGVVVVASLDELFDTTTILAHFPSPLAGDATSTTDEAGTANATGTINAAQSLAVDTTDAAGTTGATGRVSAAGTINATPSLTVDTADAAGTTGTTSAANAAGAANATQSLAVDTTNAGTTGAVSTVDAATAAPLLAADTVDAAGATGITGTVSAAGTATVAQSLVVDTTNAAGAAGTTGAVNAASFSPPLAVDTADAAGATGTTGALSAAGTVNAAQSLVVDTTNAAGATGTTGTMNAAGAANASPPLAANTADATGATGASGTTSTTRAAGTAIMTASGAVKNILLDFAQDIGLALPRLTDATLAKLTALLPDFAVADNPLDYTTIGVRNPGLIGELIDTVLADPNIGSLVLAIVVGPPIAQRDKSDHIVPALARATKPAVLTVMGDDLPLEPFFAEAIAASGVPLFRSPERALRACAHVAAYGEALQRAARAYVGGASRANDVDSANNAKGSGNTNDAHDIASANGMSDAHGATSANDMNGAHGASHATRANATSDATSANDTARANNANGAISTTRTGSASSPGRTLAGATNNTTNNAAKGTRSADGANNPGATPRVVPGANIYDRKCPLPTPGATPRVVPGANPNPGANPIPIPLPGAVPPNGIYPEYQGKNWLARAGLCVPAGRLATTLDDALKVASEIGYPVVLKAQASALPHKSDVGGVVVGLADASALRAGWARLHASVAAHRPELVLDGVLVEAMGTTAGARGLELVIGAKRDPDWGPVVLVGLGGIFIEVLKDVRLIPADMAEEDIVVELRRLKAAAMFDGARGAAGVNVPAIARAVATIGAQMRANPGIVEIDVNPLIAYADRVLALDALLVCRVGDAHEEHGGHADAARTEKATQAIQVARNISDASARRAT